MRYVLIGNDLTAWSIALCMGLKRRIGNLKPMQTRRIVPGIGVTCDTSKQQLLAIPDILRETMQAQPDVDAGRAHQTAVVAA